MRAGRIGGVLALASSLAMAFAVVGPVLADDAVVRISDAGFSPTVVTVYPIGASVHWENAGPGSHSVRFADGIDGPILAPGGVYVRTFTSAGVFPYICGVHPRMTGSIHVVAVKPAASDAILDGGVAPATDVQPSGQALPSPLEAVLLAVLLVEAAAIGAWAVRQRLSSP